MRRLLLTLAAAALAGAFAGAVPAAAADASCTTSAAATWSVDLTATGTAKVSADKPLCADETAFFTAVSYTAPAAADSYPKFIYAQDNADFVAAGEQSVTLTPAVPGCFHEIDVVRGTRTNQWLPSAAEDTAEKLAVVRGGSAACAPAPAVSFVTTCDGFTSAVLSNGPGAGVDAAFLVSQLKYGPSLSRVAPGKSLSVLLTKQMSSYYVIDSTGARHDGESRLPSTCSPSPTTSVSTSTSTSASASASVSTSASASASASPSASRSATRTPSPAAPVVTPTPTETAAPVTTTAAPVATAPVATTPVAAVSGTLAHTGANIVGIAGVAAGLVIIGAVLLVLTRRKRT